MSLGEVAAVDELPDEAGEALCVDPPSVDVEDEDDGAGADDGLCAEVLWVGWSELALGGVDDELELVGVGVEDGEIEPEGVEAVLPDEDGVVDDGEYVPSDVSDALPDPEEVEEPGDDAPVLEVDVPDDVEEPGEVEDPLGVVDPLGLAGAVGNNPMTEIDMINSDVGVVCRSRNSVT